MNDSSWNRVGTRVKSRFAVFSLLFALAVQAAFASTQGRAPVIQFYENSTSQPLVQLISKAKKSLRVEIYQMSDPNVMNAFIAALNRGVRIDVVQEPGALGSSCQIFNGALSTDAADCKALKKFVADVRSRGGRYVPFNKTALCGTALVEGGSCFEHGKMVIADEQAALISTGNFNSSNLCNLSANPARCNRDYSVITTDPEVVKALIWVHENDLKGVAYDLTPVLNLRRKLTVSPLSSQPLVEMIATAKKSIVVQNQYLYEPAFNRALMEAAQRGVKVFVQTASPCSFGPPSQQDIDRLTVVFSQFDKAGIVSRFFTSKILVGTKPGYLHAKAIIVDGAIAWVGSVNGSTTAFFKNREFGLFFTSPDQVAALYHIFEADFKHPGGATWKEGLTCKSADLN